MKKLYDLRKNLTPFIPEKALDEVVSLLKKYPIHLGLMKPRRRIFGDYCPQQNVGGFHKITVNGDLNKYAFLIIFLHEYAHLLVFMNHGTQVKAHGKEWRSYFRRLLYEFVRRSVFPEDIRMALHHYAVRMHASMCSDPQLMQVLERYDLRKRPEDEIAIEQLPFKAHFIYNGELFEKGDRLRKNFTCTRLSDGAKFRFISIAKVRIQQNFVSLHPKK